MSALIIDEAESLNRLINEYVRVEEVQRIFVYVMGGPTGAELDDFLTTNGYAFSVLANDGELLDAVVTSEIAMDAVAASQTAMNAVIASETAMASIKGSQIALDAVTDTITWMVNVHDAFGDESAVATYKLDGNGDDLGGNDAQWSGTESYADGVFGQAASFNAESGQMIVSSQNLGISGNDPRSVSFWIKLKSYSQDYRAISFGNDSSLEAFNVLINRRGNGVIEFEGFDNDEEFNYSLVLDEWFHLCFVYEGSTNISLYVNGTFEDSISIEQVETANSPLYIGGSYIDTSDPSLNGDIDQVRIFNRALTSTEVSKLANDTGGIA